VSTRIASAGKFHRSLSTVFYFSELDRKKISPESSKLHSTGPEEIFVRIGKFDTIKNIRL